MTVKISVPDEPVSDRRRPSSPGVLASARSVVLTAVREVGRTDVSRRHASDLSWLVIGQAGALALGIVSIKLLTSMGTDAYGRYALVLTVGALLSALAFGPAEQGFLRFYFPAVERGASRIYLGVLYRGLLLAVAAFGLVTCLAAWWVWSRTAGGLTPMLLAGGAFAIVSAAATPLAAMLNLLGQRRLNAILQVLERAIVVLALWSLARRGQLGVITALLAGTGGVVVAALVRTWSLGRVVAADRPTNAVRPPRGPPRGRAIGRLVWRTVRGLGTGRLAAVEQRAMDHRYRPDDIGRRRVRDDANDCQRPDRLSLWRDGAALHACRLPAAARPRRRPPS